MSFDAGRVAAEADLDLQHFRASMRQLEGFIKQTGERLASLPPGVPQIETQTLRRQAAAAETTLAAMRAQLKALPEGQPRLDVGPLKSAAAEAQATLGKVNAALSGLAAGVGVGALGAGAGVAGLAAIIKAAYDLGAAFDAASDSIRIATGATGAQLEQLQDDFDAVFTSIPTNAKDASFAVSDLSTRLGLSGEQLQAVSRQLLELSRLTGTDLTANVRGSARAFQDWGVAAADQAGVLDKFFRAAQLSGISVTTLAERLVQFGAPLRALGFNLDEATAVLAKFEREGVNSEQVLTSLRIAFSKFAEAGLEPKQTLQDLIATIRDMPDELQAAELAVKVFGARAGVDMVQAIREGRLEFDKELKAIRDGSETIAGAAAATKDAADDLRKALNELSKELRPVAAGVFDAATALTTNLIPAIRKAVELASDPRLQSLLRALATGGLTGLPGVGARLAGFGAQQAAGAVTETVRQGLATPPSDEPELRRAAALRQVAEAAKAAADAEEDLGDAQQQGSERAREATGEAGRLGAALDKTQEKVAALAEQLRAAGGDQALIQSLIAAERQPKVLDQAISTLDETLAAEVATLRNMALEVGNATGNWSLWAATVDRAADLLAVHKQELERQQQATKAAEQAQRQYAQALQQAAETGEKEYSRFLKTLGDAVLPQLDAATAVSLKEAQILGDQWAQLSIIARATGRSVDELGAILQQSGAAFAESAKQAAALAKGFQGFAQDEAKQRAQSFLSSITSGLDYATAAQLKFIAETQGAEAALQQYAASAGLNLQRVTELLHGNAAAAQQAKAALDAAQTFQQTGRLAPAAPEPPDATKQLREAMAEAQKQLRETLEGLAKQLAESQRAIAASIQAALRQRDTTLQALNAQAAQVAADYEKRLGQIRSQLQSTIAALNRQADAAIKSYEQTVRDASERLRETTKAEMERYRETTTQLADRAADAVRQVAQSERSALQSLSSALTAIRSQEIQAALQQSLQMAAIARRELAGGTAAEASELARERVEAQAAAGLAAMERVTQERQARQQFADAINEAMRQVGEVLQGVAAEQNKLQQEVGTNLRKAQEEATRAINEAQTTLDKQLDDIRRAINRAYSEAAAAMQAAQEERDRREKEIDDARREAEKRLREAEDKAKSELQTAEAAYATRQQQLHQEQRQAEERALKAQNVAWQEFRRAQDQLKRGIDENNHLHRETLKRMGNEQRFDFRGTTVQETGVDFLLVAKEKLDQVMRK